MRTTLKDEAKRRAPPRPRPVIYLSLSLFFGLGVANADERMNKYRAASVYRCIGT